MMMNKSGSLNSPAVNTPESFESPLLNTRESRLACAEYTGELDSPVTNTPGNLDTLVCLVSASEMVYKKGCIIRHRITTTVCIHYEVVLTPWIIWEQ
jgi:hypothetical protein